VKEISSIQLFQGESSAGKAVTWNGESKEVYVHRHAFKLITTRITSAFGEGELLEASI
jgi:hypothetical protein